MQYSIALLALVAAVKASPFPQAVTASIAPSASAPPGCTAATSGSFGIAVMNVTSTAAKRQVTQATDGQPAFVTMAPVSQIGDGQVQGGMHTMIVMPVNQISDGQIQQTVTMAPVTVISDGQPQAPRITPSTSTAAAVSQISDAQPQAPTSTPRPTSTAAAVSQISDAQPQATTSRPSSTATSTPSSSVVSSSSAVASSAPASSRVSSSVVSSSSSASSTSSAPASTGTSSTTMVACASNSTLTLTLNNGILTDAKGRTGYIASNYQFQFDAPPQAGAIYTAGFSLCGNGSLALGGSNVFYQCLSGGFYNLYNTNWAAQCSPVTINALTLVNCS